MTSGKKQFSWADFKSWLVTNALIFAPLFAEQLLENLTTYDWGKYGVIVALVIGSLLKAIQKYKTETYYPVQK